MNGRVDNDDGSEVARNRIRELLDEAKCDGGPVHPLSIQIAGDCTLYFDGISVRDYFAAAALQAVDVSLPAPSAVAASAYRIADAMLAQRKENKW